MLTIVPYREFTDRHKTKVYLVFFNVELSTLNIRSKPMRSFECIIDSGATNCLFDATVADALGLSVKAGRRDVLKGIGGPEECWFHDVLLHLPGGPVRISAGFKERLGIGGLLGLNGFFEHFIVTFDSPLKRCTLDRIYQA